MSKKEKECVEDFNRYEQTVTVLSAIYETIKQNPNIGRFVGVEHTIETEGGGDITPDLTAIYENSTSRIQQYMFFELKWSMSPSTIKDEVLELKRYFDAKCKMTGSSQITQQNDIILVCHLSDVKVVVKAIEDLEKSTENDFLKSGRFEVWTWAIVRKKQSSVTADEEMFLRCEYGKTENVELERLVRKPGGIAVHSDVLTFLRHRYCFIKQKPPVQYMMKILLMHVSSAYREKSSSKNKTVITQQQVDDIYDFMKNLFPGWAKATTKTVQAHRGWIIEALRKFEKLGIDLTSPPKIRKTYEEWICGKLQKLWKESARPSVRRPRRKASTIGFDKIESYFPGGNIK